MLRLNLIRRRSGPQVEFVPAETAILGRAAHGPIYLPRENLIVCPRCNRMTNGWQLKRGNGDRCAPKHYAMCVREPRNIRASLNHIELKLMEGE